MKKLLYAITITISSLFHSCLATNRIQPLKQSFSITQNSCDLRPIKYFSVLDFHKKVAIGLTVISIVGLGTYGAYKYLQKKRKRNDHTASPFKYWRKKGKGNEIDNRTKTVARQPESPLKKEAGIAIPGSESDIKYSFPNIVNNKSDLLLRRFELADVTELQRIKIPEDYYPTTNEGEDTGLDFLRYHGDIWVLGFQTSKQLIGLVAWQYPHLMFAGGFGGRGKGIAKLSYIAIGNCFQRKGYGKLLMDFTLKSLKNMGFKEVSLVSDENYKDKYKLDDYYKKMGFKAIEKSALLNIRGGGRYDPKCRLALSLDSYEGLTENPLLADQD